MAASAGLISSRVLPALALAGVVFFALLAPGVAAAEDAAAPPAGLEFRVGGPRGWRVPDANTSYGWWTANNRFRVGDHLYFKYAHDSVLVVDRPAFDACNTTAPLAAFADGATTFRLDRPGFFCFISGEPGHCEQGQKLIVRVMVHPASGPASAPGTSAQPGHGGGRPGPSGRPGASSSAVTAVTVAAGVTTAATMAVLVGLVVMFQ